MHAFFFAQLQEIDGESSSNLPIVGRVSLIDGEFDVHDLDIHVMIRIPTITTLLKTHYPRIKEGMYDFESFVGYFY